MKLKFINPKAALFYISSYRRPVYKTSIYTDYFHKNNIVLVDFFRVSHGIIDSTKNHSSITTKT